MVAAKRANAETTTESPPNVIDNMESVLSNSAKKTRVMFSNAYSQAAMDEQESQRVKLTSKIHDEYEGLGQLPDKTTVVEELPAEADDESNSAVSKLIDSIQEKPALNGQSEGVVAIRNNNQYTSDIFGDSIAGGGSLVRRAKARTIRPVWHAPWKLMRVISGHLGWVRAVAVEPGNKWFATGAGDRTIKIWDMASGTLKLSLTGHISTVRGIEVSPRHPYLFSCGEDKMVKCWDLEQNKVIRHYHGHLSGVYSLSLHPTLDVLVTSGRDATARVWDMRTKQAVHVLAAHTSTVSTVKCQETDPQVITGSMDNTMRLWDLAAGKTMGVLTHHKKSVRALALHPTEFGFVSGSADSIKGWKCPEATFIQNYERRKAIINTISINQDGVIFSGGDDGSLGFNDWRSGHNFQSMDTTVQPGSLDAEAGVFCSTFDKTGSRLITGEADKTIKIYKEDENALKDEDFYQ
ncbi:unnamed protein product [Rhizopus stolonifer]